LAFVGARTAARLGAFQTPSEIVDEAEIRLTVRLKGWIGRIHPADESHLIASLPARSLLP
jgi:hypothetical protein